MSVTQFPVPRCLYCGGEPHPVPLACPRIAQINIDEDGNLVGLVFWEDFFDEDAAPETPDDAA